MKKKLKKLSLEVMMPTIKKWPKFVMKMWPKFGMKMAESRPFKYQTSPNYPKMFFANHENLSKKS